MGSPVSQVAPSTQPSAKGAGQSTGKSGFSNIAPSKVAVPDGTSDQQGVNGQVTFPGQGGQPQMGQPNTYSNTVGQWDNASIQPRQTQSGKGKGY